ncbi:pilus assembly FimT family protein [Rheinheimera maricola]|uniref:Type II secretion system GspH family protein n=1 Tax=Rheinheimera maricola TaxID=2793282 RepID=A0ABS7X3Z5_9GAMM|nr:type II secretion system protein [Rheinheimera maricola]MBZ9610284.1 type II secretion system GspH family protein [Rheinheimera maricola]
MSLYRYNKLNGFTLIELLIVMTILALTLALVIPFSVKQVDNSLARSERQMVVLMLNRSADLSLLRSAPVRLKLAGRKISEHAVETPRELALDFISFTTETELTIRPLGLINPVQIEAVIDGQYWLLKVENDKAIWTHLN